MKSATAVHLRIHKHPTLPSPQRGGSYTPTSWEQTVHPRNLNTAGAHTKLLKSTEREDFWLVELRRAQRRGPRPTVGLDGIKRTDGASSSPNNGGRGNPSPTIALDGILDNRRGGVHTKLLKSTDREDFWLVELCVRSLAPRPYVKRAKTSRLSVGDEYMRLPPRGGSAIGGGGECVCEIRNGGASSYSQTPHPSLPSKGRLVYPNLLGTDGTSS